MAEKCGSLFVLHFWNVNCFENIRAVDDISMEREREGIRERILPHTILQTPASPPLSLQ